MGHGIREYPYLRGFGNLGKYRVGGFKNPTENPQIGDVHPALRAIRLSNNDDAAMSASWSYDA